MMTTLLLSLEPPSQNPDGTLSIARADVILPLTRAMLTKSRVVWITVLAHAWDADHGGTLSLWLGAPEGSSPPEVVLYERTFKEAKRGAGGHRVTLVSTSVTVLPDVASSFDVLVRINGEVSSRGEVRVNPS